MPTLLPFFAGFGSCDSLYIPGEETPKALPQSVPHPGRAALFAYCQRFRWPGEGAESMRMGIMGLLDVNDARVLPHEEPIGERVAAMRGDIEKGIHDPGPLWLWCNDRNHVLASIIQPARAADISVQDRFGCIHEYWRIDDSYRIENAQAALSGQPLFLADGHHRYAAGWKPAVIQTRNSALRSLASHRLLASPIDRKSILHPEDIDGIEGYLANSADGNRRFAVYTPDRPPTGFEVDGAAARRWLRPPHTQTRDLRSAIDAVRTGKTAAALLVSEPSVSQIEQDALKGALLPAKSTDFFPKLAAGVVLHCD